MGKYSKGYMASFGGFVTSAMAVSEQFCGTWLPAAAAFLGAVGVVLVPNARQSEV